MILLEELQALAGKMNANREQHSALNAVYQFHIKDAGEKYQVAFQNGAAQVSADASDPPDCTLTMTEGNLRKLLKDDLNPTLAFMTGSLKIDGSIGLALKLQELLKQYQG